MKNLVIRSGSLRMGGLERVLIEMLQNLDLKKYKISLIIEDNSGEDNIFLNQVPKEINIYFLKSEELIAKTHYHRERKKNLFNKFMYNYLMSKEHSIVVKRTQEVLKEIEKKNGEIDLFIDYDWGARRYVDKLLLKKSIVWIHNSVPKMLKKPSKIKRFGKNLDKYDVVVAICDEMKKELESTYPYLKNKIKRIYNPFNFNRIERLGEDSSELSQKDLDLLKDKYILAVSRLDTTQKDYKTLLEAFKLLKEDKMMEKLYIVGDGPSKKEIQNMIDDMELQNEVLLLGQRSNPYIWMKNSQLFVHSSKYEGFGLVLVEAMSLGKAIVASDCEVGPKEILGEGKYGKVFPVGDSLTLYKELKLLLENTFLKDEFEKKSQIRAKNFDAKVVIKEYENLIDA
ncbi:glycosyltransferase [uncultured Cetobacterium sp.]|uniref:glycosyltransferase n=1 Tax=uncultured Cetobacterium sp. TaxID=527638 RepID=UPI002618D6E1|nr:glycosyltransferase [uncultured Cetobacterium sp.]